MSDICETVRIHSDSSPDGYVVINKSDFDPALHQLFDGESSVSEGAPIGMTEGATPPELEPEGDGPSLTPKPRGRPRKAEE